MLEGDLNSALNDRLIPLIGEDTWDSIQSAFDDGSSDSKDVKVIGFARGALVNLAYFYFAQAGGIQATNEGLMQASGADRKSAFHWQALEFRQNKLDQGYMYIGKLLAYLDANKDYFTAWPGSDEQSLYAKLFLRDLSVFNRYRKIAGFETLIALIPYMLRVQEQSFAARITQTLFDSVYSQYQNGNVDANNGPLVPYLQEYVAHQALCDALYELNFQFTAEGMRIWSLKSNASSTREEQSALDEIAKAKTYLQMAADNAMAKLIQYLNVNASAEKYSSYYTDVVLVEAESGNAIDNLNESLKKGTSFVL
jgi:hypothetical protein